MKYNLSLFIESMHQNAGQIVSITRQGQVTIPKTMRKSFGIKGAVKAVIWKSGDQIVMEPKQDFWSLAGSLRGRVKLSDTQLHKARQAFAKKWAKHD